MITVTWKTIIAIAVLLFSGAIISVIVWKGDPANSLHQSALSWSYFTGLVILTGIGFGTMVDTNLINKLMSNK